MPDRKPAVQASRSARPARTRRFSFRDPLVKVFAAVFLIAGIVFLGIFAYVYVKYERVVDRRMAGGIFSNAAKIYARPHAISVGEKLDEADITAELRRAGYSEEGDSPIGHYHLGPDGLHVMPGPQSFHGADSAAVVRFDRGKVSSISAAGGNHQEIAAYELEPQLVTALFEGQDRSKRELIKFQDIPPVLVNAVLAIEDRRFFQHGGVNYFRLIEAAAVDLREGRHEQGGSTITMQLSRGFFLTPQKTLKRKLTEMMIAIELEQKFSKQRIFEMYANEVYLGQRGSFTINGFGEASHAYFNKDVKNLTLPEAALLAGMIQRPNYLSPYKNPKRALERRNLVLDSMVDTGTITSAEAEQAKAAPLTLATPNVEASDAPYFVDLVKDQLSGQFNEQELNNHALRIYTTIDPDLQRAAAEAVEMGMKVVDDQVIKRRTHKIKTGTGKDAKTEITVESGPMPQVALVAIDPHTGEILALVGGRNYGMSQLDHAIAKRPTGSIFKPFVYAAAINTAVTGQTLVADTSTPDSNNDSNSDSNSDSNARAATSSDGVFTPASLIDDAQVSIAMNGSDQVYEPRNYHEAFHGEVTARYALAESLNNATVRLGQEVGFDKVAALAKAAGISSVRATPAIALGAYDATPVEMAGAYTVFANGGTRLAPLMVTSVRDARGNVLNNYHSDTKQVLDPRVAYVMTTMLEAVVNNGTGYPVRARGFEAPAAGKTGTSHDAWFAGYTSNLLCVVWVGNDDYTDIKLAGGAAAAPIWAEFMKRAIKVPQYADVSDFKAPQGVVTVQLDKVTNRLATPACPEDYTVAFIAGTEPKDTCEQTSGDHRGFFSKVLGLGAPTVAAPPNTNGPVSSAAGDPQAPAGGDAAQAQPPKPKKKKGFFLRFFGHGDSSDEEQDSGTNAEQNGNTTSPK
ncbi:MAG: transglycosylase domain-containing protein [Candidatus Korobacteraceae bacterium]